MEIRSFSIAILLVLIFGRTGAQEIVVHFDKPYYVAGDIIFYTVAFSDLQKDTLFVARAELGNSEESLGHHFVTVSNSYSQGHFKIPHDVKSNYYYFSLDIFESKTNSPHQILLCSLAVYNASDANDLPVDETKKGSSDDSPLAPIPISLDHEPVRTRQNISGSLKTGDAAVVSVVIRERSGYPYQDQFIHASYQAPPEPYLYGIPISGKRIPPGYVVWNPLFFALNVPALDFAISVVRKDSLFNLALPPFHGEQNIDFIDYVWDDASVELTPMSRTYPNDVLTIDAQIKANLEINKLRKKIYSIYNTVEQTLQFRVEDPPIPKVESDYEVDVPDFAIQGTLLNLFKEIIAPLKFRREGDGRQRARMIYEAEDGSHFYNSRTKFIVNGQVTRDGNYVANIPLQEVEYITIYHDLEKVRKHFGPIGTGGVVVIEMKDKTFSLPDDICMPDRMIQGLQNLVEYPIKVSESAREPQLKSTLYWQPFTPTDAEGMLQFEFTTSDDLSDFEIIAVGIDRQGQVMKGSDVFQISQHSTN